jgi:hypothetical protein
MESEVISTVNGEVLKHFPITLDNIYSVEIKEKSFVRCALVPFTETVKSELDKIFQTNCDEIKPGSKIYILPKYTVLKKILLNGIKNSKCKLVDNIEDADIIITNSNYKTLKPQLYYRDYLFFQYEKTHMPFRHKSAAHATTYKNFIEITKPSALIWPNDVYVGRIGMSIKDPYKTESKFKKENYLLYTWDFLKIADTIKEKNLKTITIDDFIEKTLVKPKLTYESATSIHSMLASKSDREMGLNLLHGHSYLDDPFWFWYAIRSTLPYQISKQTKLNRKLVNSELFINLSADVTFEDKFNFLLKIDAIDNREKALIMLQFYKEGIQRILSEYEFSKYNFQKINITPPVGLCTYLTQEEIYSISIFKE